MTTADKVRAAKNPQEAMLAIAEALDQLLERPYVVDEWSSWDEPYDHSRAKEDARAEVVEAAEYTLSPALTPDVAEKVVELSAELARATTDNDKASIQARMKLLLDTGQSIPEVDVGERTRTVDEGDTLVNELPSVDAETFAARLLFAKQRLQLNDMLDGDEDWCLAYAKGGPLWLYYGNRDLVLSYDRDIRREMVRDVMQTSPTEAHEMGRDLFKADETTSLPDFTPNT